LFNLLSYDEDEEHMSTLRSIKLAVGFVLPTTLGGAVFDLFQADPDLLAVGVLDETGAPVGLIDRHLFTLKLGSTYGRALYAGRPISLLMDANPLRVEADMEVAAFAQAALAKRAGDLMRGFVVVDHGRVLGVGSLLALLQAMTNDSVEATASLSAANAVLKAAEEKAQASHALLLEALNAMGEGVAVLDSEDRFVVWNAKYAQLHDRSDDVLAPGAPFETLLRHGAANGQYREAVGQEQAWGDQRMLRRAQLTDRASEEQELSGGQHLRIEDTRLKGGGSISVAVDLTEIKRREASFRLLFESNPVPLAVLDRRDLKVLAVNEAARARYGYEGVALDDLYADQVLAEEEHASARAERLGRTEAAYAGEQSWTCLTASGERLRVRLYMHPLAYHGRPATLVAAVDVTAQLQAEATLKTALQAAEDADRAKSEFLANTSHELRTPLNGIIGMASVLSRTHLSAEQGEMVEVIRTSGATLQTLLSDVLDLAKIEAGQIDLQSEPVSPASLARHVARLFAAPVAAKGLTLELDLDAGSEAAVLADSVRLTQVLTNLCSNAVKFTEHGRVRLSVRAAADGPRRRVAFAVADTGIGMGPEARTRVFERFAQADGSITRRFGGTGLGLAISRYLVELMGGRIELESAPGRGSTFYLEFSLPAAAAPALVASSPPLSTPDVVPKAGETLRALLVEDHPVNRQVVQLMLRDLVELDVAENGLEAVEAARARDYDVILMDMQMPVMDGITATRLIREGEAGGGRPRARILMLTANALPEHAERSRQAGADTHLAKPITAEALLGALDHLAGSDAAPAAQPPCPLVA
jgi:two-component system, sensor histidine kinase